MTDTAASSAPPPRRPRPSRTGERVRLIGALGLVLVLVVLVALYLNRRMATREVLVGWLERHGIEAEIDIQRLELDGIVASISVGDPLDPDVVIERVEVDYAISLPWATGGAGLTPSRIRLVRPVAKARWQDGQLSFGSLDPLIADFMRRPPQPDTRGPRVLIESGRVRLTSDYGQAELLGDAEINDGKLMRLAARLPQTALKHGELAAVGLAGTLNLTTSGDRVAVRTAFTAQQASLPGWQGEQLAINVTGDLPYPDNTARRGDGQARVRARLASKQVTSGQNRFRDLTSALDFDGQTAGWINAFHITGQSDLTLAAGRISGPGVTGRAVSATLDQADTRLDRDDTGVKWRFDGAAGLTAAQAGAAGLAGSGLRARAARLTVGGRGSAFEVAGPVALSIGRLSWADLTLNDVRSTVDLDVVQETGLRIEATGPVRAARASWPLFGAPARDDIPELGEMKRALSAFAVDAPALRLTAGDSGARLVMTRPVRLSPVNGGVLTLDPVNTPVFAAPQGQAGGGALTLTATRGRGLPEAAFSIPAWRLTPGGFTATLDGRAALDFGLARGIDLQTRGELASRRGTVTYTSAGCVSTTVARLELDENDVTDLSGALCPVNRPLVTIASGAWRAEAALRDMAATAPFLAMHFDTVEGRLVATGSASGLGLDARVSQARVSDTTDPRRFHPISATGQARLARDQWTGAFDLTHGRYPVGHMTVAHDGRSGRGGIDITATDVTFAENRLQPGDLSPLVDGLIEPPVTGSVDFAGRIDWTGSGEGTSSGLLTIPGLDFTSPVGPVKGLKGAIAFTSLTPLVTAPGQSLTADSLDSFTVLSDLDLTFSLDESALTLGGGEVAVAGGTVRIEPLVVALNRTQPFTGVVVLENVQLGDVIAGAGFGDAVQMDAVVSGRLPFVSDPVKGIRVTGGSLYATRPGRLSIQRTALSGLEAGGGGDEVPPNTVQDLAYQAMENLAFDILTAELNSLDEGRLSILFHIKGRHDPPVRQEIRLSWLQLIRRDFLNQTLPLPSNTGIDLTLDTTLNVNQLVSDLLAVDRARRGNADEP